MGKKLALMIAIGMTLAGCAHTAIDEKLDAKLAQEKNINSRDDLHKEANLDLTVTKGLSLKQKAELEQLRTDIRGNEDSIWRQSLRLRAVLIKDMLASEYNEPEVNAIQQRMRDLENRRLTLQFEAIDRANKILGHEFEDTDMLNQFFETQ